MMGYQVYVVSKNGKPLMATKRFGKVRRLLKSGRAKSELFAHQDHTAPKFPQPANTSPHCRRF